MNDIKEITGRMFPIMDASIQLAAKYLKIQPLQFAVHNLQLAVYWFKEAEKDMEAIQSETLTSEDTSTALINLKAPTLLSATDSFSYLSTQLNTLNTELFTYKEDMALPFSVKYKLDRGYDKLMDAKFNLQLSEIYYEQLSKGK